MSMLTEPTNQDLKETFEKHALADQIFQDMQMTVNEEAAKSRESIHKRLGELATKEDTQQILELIKAVKIGSGFFSFTWNNAAKIGQFIFFILGIMALLKYGILGAFAWLFNKTP